MVQKGCAWQVGIGEQEGAALGTAGRARRLCDVVVVRPCVVAASFSCSPCHRHEGERGALGEEEVEDIKRVRADRWWR